MSVKYPVKLTDPEKGIVSGVAVPYGGPMEGRDLQGEFFSEKTDLHLDWFPDGRPLLYDHGFDASLREQVVGRQVKAEVNDVGIWAEAQLNRAHRYFEAIMELVGEGALGFSSGSVHHLVTRSSSGEILNWPWIELSLTPTPANPWATIDPAKSLSHLRELGLTAPDPLLAILKRSEPASEPSTPCVHCGSGKSLEEHYQETVSLLDSLVERVEGVAALRARKGRSLSSLNQERLTAVRSRIEGLLSHFTEPDPEPDHSALDQDRDRRLHLHALSLRSLQLTR